MFFDYQGHTHTVPQIDNDYNLPSVSSDSQLMSSAEAWRLSNSRNSSPVDVAFCEDLIDELSSYISRIHPEVSI